jgi:asparagine synthase (glutamine-hydrolysing)
VCGIAVLLDPQTAPPDADGRAMIEALRHRGPDDADVRRIGPTLIAHTRLSIVDLEGGRQPLSSEDGAVTAVVNGEIYNHEDLRAELEALGHRFATRSDSEAVVHAYEEWGSDALRRLNGIFAFVLWDNRRRRLLAARDPFGVKPLYWTRRGSRLGVASEVGALIAAGLVRPSVDPVALDHFLAWRFVPAPRTLFDGVSKLAPASYLEAGDDGRPKVHGYREAPGDPITDASADELAEQLRAELVAAVTRQTMADVPYAAFLSGGVDSAAIVAALRQGVGGVPSTFTIGFPGFGPGLDESAAAAETATELGTDHHLVTMGEVDFPADVAASVARLEEPCGSPSAPALLQLSRFTARSVKVVLSGQGADEPLGGYQRAQAAAALRLVERVPAAAGRGLEAAAGLLPRNERAKRAAGVLATPSGLDRLLRVFEITTPELRRRLRGTGPDGADERSAIAADVIADVAGRDLLDQALYLDTRVFLPDHLLLYGDKMSMAHGLELRVPFLDHELMRFVERIPARVRMRRGERKWLYRNSVRGLVPDAVLDRPKVAFTTPYDQWLRSSLAGEIERTFAPGAGVAEHVDAGVVRQLVDEHRRGRADHKRLLYCLLELGEWNDLFPAGSPPALLAA